MVCIGSDSDVLLVGGGPAGLTLAAELGRRGVSVLVVHDGWGTKWARSYGSWAGGLPPDLVEVAGTGRFERPCVTFSTGEQTSVEHAYVRFDTARLQTALEERAAQAGALFFHGRFSGTVDDGGQRVAVAEDPHGQRHHLRARVMVDCSGGALARSQHQAAAPAFQSAFGVWMEVDRMPFGADSMSLMDLRATEADGVPERSFLYAMPERSGLLFAQETVLASRRPVSMKVLQGRLRARLRQTGVHVRQTLESERCLIPLGLAPRAAAESEMLSFGAAAGLIQPSSGYCLGSILRLAPRLAEVLTAGLDARSSPTLLHERAVGVLWPDDARRTFSLQMLGLETLLRWGARQTDAFWQAFFDLPGDTAPRFMDGRLSASEMTAAMLRIFFRVPLRLRLELARGGARFLSQATTRGFS